MRSGQVPIENRAVLGGGRPKVRHETKNEEYYEQTRQLIETKGWLFGNPSSYLKHGFYSCYPVNLLKDRDVRCPRRGQVRVERGVCALETPRPEPSEGCGGNGQDPAKCRGMRLRNTRCYEQSHQVIENKGPDF